MSGNGTFSGWSSSFSSGIAGTLLRVIGEYVIVPTAAPAAADAVVVSVAMGIISTDALTIGATAFPDPLSDPGYPWMYWMSHAFHFGTTELDPSQAGGSVRRFVDSRAMRKIKPSESLILSVQYKDIAGTPPMTFIAGDFRVLFGG